MAASLLLITSTADEVLLRYANKYAVMQTATDAKLNTDKDQANQTAFINNLKTNKLAEKLLLLMIYLLVAIYASLLLLINVLLYIWLQRPMQQLTVMANQVSMGQKNVVDVNFNSNDEMSTLAASFNRMRRSLEKAMHLLEKKIEDK
jgi:nitrate/nitrite-specific signal transduction histidine kinase